VDTNESALLPNEWLQGQEEAWWPPFGNAMRINRAAKEHALPEGTWTLFQTKILYSNGEYISPNF